MERELRATTSTGPSLSVIVSALDVALVISDEVDGWGSTACRESAPERDTGRAMSHENVEVSGDSPT